MYPVNLNAVSAAPVLEQCTSAAAVTDPLVYNLSPHFLFIESTGCQKLIWKYENLSLSSTMASILRKLQKSLIVIDNVVSTIGRWVLSLF